MDRDQGSCSICGTGVLHELTEFAELSRVTSDSRTLPPGGKLTVCRSCGAVQKIADAAWRAEIAEIYADFTLDHQSGGEEQLIFDADGVGLPRSQRIVNLLDAPLAGKAPVKVLDFGCGRGATMKVLAQHWPGVALYGTELNAATEPELRKIPGFQRLYTEGTAAIEERFDLVMLVHSLAHVIAPVETLRALSACMEPDGTLMIQTPDAETNLFYILVADALTHFTADVLRRAAGRASFGAAHLTTEVAPNELSYFGKRSAAGPAIPVADPELSRRRAEQNIRWLREQAAAARRISADHGKFGIFGSSLAASWLAREIGERFDFFVDEDPRRLGKTHMGRPIVGVAAIPPGAAVFVPLAPNVAARVAARLRSRGIACHTA